jgi:hypothetical protein
VIAVAWVLFAVALGCAVVYRFGGLQEIEPRWAAALLIFGAGTAAGIGSASCLFFVCRAAVPRIPKLALFIEVAIFVWLVYEIWRKRDSAARPEATARSPFTLLLALAMIVALGVATSAMADAWEANPQGGWDAWLIWNLRARFLAVGTQPQRAWSPELNWTHPEYPFLTSAFVARCWTYAGSVADAAPIATSYLFFLATIALLSGGLAAWRSRLLGLLCGLVLLGSPSFLHEAPTQYADIPLACYFAGATMLLLVDRPLMAGLFAGFAAWTKDEGILFLAVFLAVIVILRRKQILRIAAGAIPGAALTAVFKLALAPRISIAVGGGASAIVRRAMDPGRIGQVLSAFAHEFAGMGAGWYHPILPLMALAIALRFDRERRADLLLTGAIPMATLAGYFCVFLVTPYDLKWQLETTLNRILVQVWPCLLLLTFGALRAPESAAIQMPESSPKTKKGRRVMVTGAVAGERPQRPRQ